MSKRNPRATPTREMLLARAEALEECAGHLELGWTDDPIERAEGMRLSDKFRRQAIILTRRATTDRKE